MFNGNLFYDVGVAMEKVLSPCVFDLKEGWVNNNSSWDLKWYGNFFTETKFMI